MIKSTKPKKLEPNALSNSDLFKLKKQLDEELERYIKHGLIENDGQTFLINPYGKAYKETFAYFKEVCKEIEKRIVEKTILDNEIEEDISVKKEKGAFYLDRIVTKENNPNAYDRIKWFNNENEYLDYLMILDLTINGTDQIINGYEPVYKFIEKRTNYDPLKINEEIDKLLKEIGTNLQWIISIEPKHARASGIEGGTDMLYTPEDDTVHYTKYLVDKVVGLRNLLKQKEGF